MNSGNLAKQQSISVSSLLLLVFLVENISFYILIFVNSLRMRMVLLALKQKVLATQFCRCKFNMEWTVKDLSRNLQFMLLTYSLGQALEEETFL